MRNVFISYHHENDQPYKRALSEMAVGYGLFNDCSVQLGDIDEALSDEAIRTKIRDEYLRDTSVTVVLVGAETRGRKHVDWEIASSMRNSPKNKQSGVVVVQLPEAQSSTWISAFGEAGSLYGAESWVPLSSLSRAELERRHPRMPTRIMDNLVEPGVKIPVTNWATIAENPYRLQWLVEKAGDHAGKNSYAHQTLMRTKNSPRLGNAFEGNYSPATNLLLGNTSRNWL